MSKITLNSIIDLAGEHGWTVESEEYTNLDTEMSFICNEGHHVYNSWKKIRDKWYCPLCEKNLKTLQASKVIKKDKNIYRIIALDQSSHITGYSIFDGNKLIDYGIFEPEAEDEIARGHILKEWLVSMIEKWKPDMIGIEGIQYQQYIGITTFQTLARIQGILMECCYDFDIKYNICPTNTWRHTCGVTGKSRVDKKKSTQNLIKKWYDVSVTEDEADAIGIGRYLTTLPRNGSYEIEEWD